MGPVRIRLNFKAMQILFAELPPHEMEAMHLMVLGKEMPDKITKLDLTVLIAFLCHKLEWIEEDTTNLDLAATESLECTEQIAMNEKCENSTTNSVSISPEENLEKRLKILPNSATAVLLTIEEPLVKDKNCRNKDPLIGDIHTRDSSNKITEITGDGATKATLSERNISFELEMPETNGTHKRSKIGLEKTTEKLIHTRVKPVSCSNSDYKSSKTSTLKDHERIHGTVKKYSCSYCNKSFRTKYHLKQHKMIHTGEKSLSCTECDHKSKSIAELKIHAMKHTDKKPLSYTEMDHTFKSTTDLKTHALKRMGEKPFNCEDCDTTFFSKFSLQVWSLKQI